MNYVFTDRAWDDYTYWKSIDRKVLKRINELLRDIERNGDTGIGKPELLRHGFHGYSSRRISREHRLIYKVADQDVLVAACRYHYS
ncbi:MAG TPA: Txe/YoeB family addiction module toxin [Galbitalea sp.]|nr:Txe/YoeB family addiction module toxin [Galbitalea sp.]